MTSYYKSFHKKLSPLSKFRYPNKMSVEELNRYVDEFGYYKDEFNIETVTFELKSLEETFSVIIQVISFKLTGKRVFMMAPLHHHFDKKGWAESTIVIRFWIIAIILALIGLATLKLR